MYKKYLLILLLVCIFGGLYYVAKVVQNIDELPEGPIAAPSTEDIPMKGFKDLELFYYGQDERYRMNTTLGEIVEESNGNITFRGLDALLQEGGTVLQKFAGTEGILLNTAGVIKLTGPVRFEAGKYQLFMNNVNVDLNTGNFQATGAISLAAENLAVEAGEMSADFQFKQIHFKGRPRLTVKKGG